MNAPVHPFIIDNTAAGGGESEDRARRHRAHATFKAVDALSVIKRGEFSVDGGDWQFVPPADGIADSLSEGYSFLTGELTPGEHVIAGAGVLIRPRTARVEEGSR